jgi:hypothetical protein
MLSGLYRTFKALLMIVEIILNPEHFLKANLFSHCTQFDMSLLLAAS